MIFIAVLLWLAPMLRTLPFIRVKCCLKL